MSILPDIFDACLDDEGVHADVLADPARRRADFVAKWRELDAALGPGRVFAMDRATGESYSVRGAAFFSEGGVEFDIDAADLDRVALFADDGVEVCDYAEDLTLVPGDGPAGTISYGLLRAVLRHAGVPEEDLDDACARFAWEGDFSAMPAGEVLPEALSGGAAVFESRPAAPAVPPAASTPLREYSFAALSKARADIRREIDAVARRSAKPLAHRLEDILRLGSLSDSLCAGDFAGEHAEAVRKAREAGEPVALEALADHPEFDPASAVPPMESARHLVRVRQGGDCDVTVSVPLGKGECYEVTFSLDSPEDWPGVEAVRDAALARLAASLTDRGDRPREVADRLHPYCIPAGRPGLAASGSAEFAVRPALGPDGAVWHSPSARTPGGAWESIGRPRPTYREALAALASCLAPSDTAHDPDLMEAVAAFGWNPDQQRDWHGRWGMSFRPSDPRSLTEDDFARATFARPESPNVSMHENFIGTVLADGKRFFYKGVGKAKAEEETLGMHLAELAGVRTAGTRYAVVPGAPSRVPGEGGIVTEWLDGQTVAAMSRGVMAEHDKIRERVESKVPPSDIDRNALFNFLCGVPDRHIGNYMVAGGRLASIDFDGILWAANRDDPDPEKNELGFEPHWAMDEFHLNLMEFYERDSDAEKRQLDKGVVAELAKAAPKMAQLVSEAGTQEQAAIVRMHGEVLADLAAMPGPVTEKELAAAWRSRRASEAYAMARGGAR